MDYKEFLEETVKNCKSKADLCRALDKKPTGGNYKTIDNLIKKYNLDISHFSKSPWNKGESYYQHHYTLNEILIEDSPYTQTTKLKERLFKSGLKERKCENCGKTERLELHHINGDPSDNRIENLKILCIECHYDTDTYRNNNGRGRKHAPAADLILDEKEKEIHKKARILSKKNNISIEEAVKIVKDNPNLDLTTRPRNTIKEIECPVCHKIFKPKRSEQIYCSQECSHKRLMKSEITKEKLLEELKRLNCNLTQVGKVFNMTDNAIRKWCVKFNMPKHSSELKDYIKNI